MYDKKDFNKYAIKHLGLSSTLVEQYEKNINNFGGQIIPMVGLTPNIVEERKMNAVVLDVFSRLIAERIIWLFGPIVEVTGPLIQAQLMYLDSIEHKDIIMHVDSPGGSVTTGLSIKDVMDYVPSDVATINTGMAASMGAVLLASGQKGKRASLRYSKTMVHQSSGGAVGNIQDAEIAMQEWKEYNDILFQILGESCGKDAKEVKEDAKRDKWFWAQEAKDYGLIDKIIVKKSTK